MTLKIQKIEPTGVVYSDPLQTDLTVRVKHGKAAKNVGGVPLVNHVTEIIFNDDYPVTVGDKTVMDAVSVRVRVSGSALSMPRVKQLLASLNGVSNEWHDESVFVGFNPDTPPVVAAEV